MEDPCLHWKDFEQSLWTTDFVHCTVILLEETGGTEENSLQYIFYWVWDPPQSTQRSFTVPTVTSNWRAGWRVLLRV